MQAAETAELHTGKQRKRTDMKSEKKLWSVEVSRRNAHIIIAGKHELGKNECPLVAEHGFVLCLRAAYDRSLNYDGTVQRQPVMMAVPYSTVKSSRDCKGHEKTRWRLVKSWITSSRTTLTNFRIGL